MLATHRIINFAWGGRTRGSNFLASDVQRQKGLKGSLRCEILNRLGTEVRQIPVYASGRLRKLLIKSHFKSQMFK